ncbi:MAG: hypothetical protein H6Q10_1118 [Acidobacteria bacterium]|nr:hypothetical protein [Acidobacteriota bacterium]
MVPMRGWLVIAAVALLAGACGPKAKPQVQPETTPLQVPAAPPRVIVPPEPEPVPLEPPPEPEQTASRPARRSTPSQKPAAKPDAPPPAVTEAPAAAPPAESLEPKLPTSAADVERRVRQQLQRASNDLNRVDYGALSADGKGQYDMAKRFIEQADVALRDRNLVFAGKLAEKAAGIASVLLGR